MFSDEQLMQRCIDLAHFGLGSVAPNPMVGAVLVYNERVIGEGWHQKWGAPHAEVNCIQSVAKEDLPLISKSRLYVSLEPCSHFGKTPPCSDLIIQKQIPEVIIGCKDSFSKVAGRGIQKLKDSGIKVTVGILEQECRQLNKRFFTHYEKKRPYIFLKWAESLDGFIGRNDGIAHVLSDWPEQRAIHHSRQQEGAVLVGYQTAKNDNPRLNNRYWPGGKQPLRVVLDFENSLGQDLHLKTDDQHTVIFNFKENKESGNLRWVKISPEENRVEEILKSLPDNLDSLIVEGGAKTLRDFIKSGLWDEAFIWRSDAVLLQDGVIAPVLTNSNLLCHSNFGKDQLFHFANKSNPFFKDKN